MSTPEPRGQKKVPVVQVARVNREVRRSLERYYGDLWVVGEISDVKRPPSGHVYLTLSDEREVAQLSVMISARYVPRLRTELRVGERVKVRGKLSLYEPRGSYQLLGVMAVRAGEGGLAARFARIQKTLAAEGLLADDRKRALPRVPRVVGVVTSRSGAALRDILRVAHDRSPCRIVVADCRVQGEAAPASIVRALRAIQRLDELDVVIIGRGGGSSEDLWAFNDENVARAVAACRVPIVSGVGHETDVAISDLVADRRAATPSNAAEIVVPDRAVLLAEQAEWERRLMRGIERRLTRHRLTWSESRQRLGDPRHRLAITRALWERQGRALNAAIAQRQARHRERLDGLQARLAMRDPRALLAGDRAHLESLEERAHEAMKRAIYERRAAHRTRSAVLRSTARPMTERAGVRFRSLAGKLHALSPLSVLERGYAIAFDEEGLAIKSAAQVEVGADIRVRVSEGELSAKVTKVEEPK